MAETVETQNSAPSGQAPPAGPETQSNPAGGQPAAQAPAGQTPAAPAQPMPPRKRGRALLIVAIIGLLLATERLPVLPVRADLRIDRRLRRWMRT